jgi:hypothetical protein
MSRNTINYSFGSPVRDSAWSNIWAGGYQPRLSQSAADISGQTGPTGADGASWDVGLDTNAPGQYIYSNGTGWTTGGDNIKLGAGAGRFLQGDNSIAIGLGCGYYSQGQNSIAIGLDAGSSGQGELAIAIGSIAGVSNQGTGAIAIGCSTGRFNQGENSIVIGFLSGRNNMGQESIVIGSNSGISSQANNSIIIGANSENSPAAIQSIAIGNSNNTDAFSIAIGNSIQTNSQTGCIVLSSEPLGVSCTDSNQFVLAGVDISDPSPSGDLPVVCRLPPADDPIGQTGDNIWLPVQIGADIYYIPIYPL